jgi:hypothetical protein
MVEHIGAGVFRVADVTVQMQGGTFATFVRRVEGFIRRLRAFFKATGEDYVRFNYIGEWHSHHSFGLAPSCTDHETMVSIVADRSVGARFVVLLIIRLGPGDALEHSLTVYLPNGSVLPGDLVTDSA